MNEAVRYIIHLNKKIKELEARKNEKLSNLNKLDGDDESLPPSCFTISPSCGGIEIVINSSYIEGEVAFPVSRVLKVLIEEGLGIFSCTSSKVDTKIVHIIQSEVLIFLASFK